MKKLKSIILFILITNFSCKSTQTGFSESIEVSEHTSNTKTVSRPSKENSFNEGLLVTLQIIKTSSIENIIISKNDIKYIYNKKSTTIKISNEDWQTIKNTLLKIDLETLGTHKPIKSDSISKAYIYIIKGDVEYSSMAFNYKKPPNQLKELLKNIVSLKETVIKDY